MRGTPYRTYEAGVDQRTVVVEFESVQSAVAAYESPAYQAPLKKLDGGAEQDIRMVEEFR